MLHFKSQPANRHAKRRVKESGFTLVEMLIMVLLVGILVGLTILKSFEVYERGVVYSKIEAANSINKAIQTAYIRGFHIDQSYLESIIPATIDENEHFDGTVAILEALHEGRRNATDFHANHTSSITDDSFRLLRQNLESTRFREHTAITGHFLIRGDSHNNLEIAYIRGVH